MYKNIIKLGALLLVFSLGSISVEDSRSLSMLYQAIIDRRPLADLISIVDEDIVDLNIAEFHGLTPLMIAVKANSKPLVEYILLKKPAPDIHLTDYEGKNALMYAAGSEDVPDSQESIGIMEDLLLKSPQDVVAHSLILAARAGYVQKVVLLLKRVTSYEPRDLALLKKRLEDLEGTYKKIIDLLALAKKSVKAPPVIAPRSMERRGAVGSDAFAEVLGEFYYSVIYNKIFDQSVRDDLGQVPNMNTQDNLGMTPLIVGAKAKHIPLVEYVLSKDATPPALDIRDIEGRTALVYAAGNIMDQGEPYTNQQVSIIQPGTDSENEKGLTNSEILIKNNSLALVNILLDRASYLGNPDPDAQALRAAAFAGFVSVVGTLLERGYYSVEQLTWLEAKMADLISQYKKIEEVLAQYLTGIVVPQA